MNRSLQYVTMLFLILPCLLFAQTSNPLAYFPFNGNADDESGNGNHGSVVGAALTEDRFGNDSSAYSFNGIDNYIAYPTLWSSSPTALTMAAWFISEPTLVDGKILYHGDNGEFQLIAAGDTAIGAVHLGQNLSTGWQYAYGSIEPNNWNFIATVWKQNESLKLYINGILVDSIEVISEQLLDPGPTYEPSIGSYGRTLGAYFNGKTDDIRIYDRALSVDEIDSLFNEGTTSVEEIGLTIPNEFKLTQNYPNPFNPSTKIRYSIPTESFVKLTVYNTIGEAVAELVNQNQVAGIYDADFSAAALSSGIYFYQLNISGPQTSSGQGFVETKKMILLK